MDADDERATELSAEGAPTAADRTGEAGADSATQASSTEPSRAVSTAAGGDAHDVDTDRSDTGDLDAGDAADPRAVLSRRLAALAFGVYLVAAFGLLLFHYGDGMWFGGDDWGFLDGRSLWSAGDVLRPQNGHWVTVPVIVYQVLYRLFGLHSYVPYQVLTVLLHLTLCVLLRWVMRRAGVGPWVATITAGTFVLFGTGWENLLLALQITLVGSVVFGILQLILADHDGPAGWRDAAALGAGLVALMCSSVGVIMVAIVGLSTLMRRGWRMALLQTAPLAAAFGVWFLAYRGNGEFDGDGGLAGLQTDGDSMSAPVALLSWLRASIGTTLASLGGSSLAAIALVCMLLVGVGLAISNRGWLGSRRTLAMPISLGLGALLLMTFIGSQRLALMQVYPSAASASRYQAMVAALVLPALGVAAAELIRRQRLLAPVVVGVLLLGVPANIAAFDSNSVDFYKRLTGNSRTFVLVAAESDVAADVPEDVHPDPHELKSANLTVGFLRFARKAGKLPDAPRVDIFTANRVNTRLRITQSLFGEQVPPHTCREAAEPFEVQARAGDRFVIGSPIHVAIVSPSGAVRPEVAYSTDWSGPVLTSQFDQTFVVSPVAGQTVVWCPAD